MTKAQRKLDAKPWYRQFWPWFLVLIPLAGITMSMITVTTAFKNADEVIERSQSRALDKNSWRQTP